MIDFQQDCLLLASFLGRSIPGTLSSFPPFGWSTTLWTAWTSRRRSPGRSLTLGCSIIRLSCTWLNDIYLLESKWFSKYIPLYQLCQLFILFTKSAFFCVTVQLWLKKISWSTSYMKQFLWRCNRMIYLVAALQFQRHDQYHVDFAVENEGIAIPKTNKKCREGVCRDWVTAVTESLGKPVIGGSRLVVAG